ncbi:hypothetical protein GCM10008960_35110 [Deinococcus sedimenti]|uniref:Uncharacterized protein n=1 Tax=Deinococcus sedimenti TaxID=1867090 RepID=A0ABQ2SAP3_9DEIO|nr:hypothetical protein GCM10008960_35110 [Deinococcus sedimenti]
MFILALGRRAKVMLPDELFRAHVHRTVLPGGTVPLTAGSFEPQVPVRHAVELTLREHQGDALGVGGQDVRRKAARRAEHRGPNGSREWP